MKKQYTKASAPTLPATRHVDVLADVLAAHPDLYFDPSEYFLSIPHAPHLERRLQYFEDIARSVADPVSPRTLLRQSNWDVISSAYRNLDRATEFAERMADDGNTIDFLPVV